MNNEGIEQLGNSEPLIPLRQPEPEGRKTTVHTVFDDPELLAKLYMHQTELGYKLVGFFTACATIYVAAVGFALQQYFVALKDAKTAAAYVGGLGLGLSILSLAAPFILEWSLRRIERTANVYAAALGIEDEKFVVVRFGGRLAGFAFLAITVGWTTLFFRAL